MSKQLYLICLLVLLNTNIAYALQTKIVADNETITAYIAKSELTRIFVAGDRIKHVRGIEGVYTYQNDNEQGAIFIKPTVSYTKQPFSLFITTEYGKNYMLLLVPKETTADSIMLVPKDSNKPQAKKWEEFASYEHTLVRLIVAMVNNTIPEGYAVNHITKVKRLALKDMAYLQLITTYQGNYLRGEVYKLQNHLTKSITIAEQDLYRPTTRAIAISQHVIPPKKTTYVYLVMSND